MRRRLFTILSAVWLVLCVSTCALWVRGYGYHDRVHWVSSTGRRGAESSRGRLLLWRQRADGWTYDAQRPGWSVGHTPSESLGNGPPGLPMKWEFAGVSVRRDYAMETYFLYVGVPYCWVAAVLLIPIALVSYRRLHNRVHSTGVCPVCAYDLRATPDRCPECGTVPTKAVKA